MKIGSSGSSVISDASILLDTHVIVWMATGDPRLKRVDAEILSDPDRELCVSAVVAFELADLQQRGRIAMTEPLDFLQQKMELRLLDLPAECWRVANNLAPIHKDPVDRMLVAHALIGNMTLATADVEIRRYPVDCI